jgi:hypothetical protein
MFEEKYNFKLYKFYCYTFWINVKLMEQPLQYDIFPEVKFNFLPTTVHNYCCANTRFQFFGACCFQYVT